MFERHFPSDLCQAKITMCHFTVRQHGVKVYANDILKFKNPQLFPLYYGSFA